MPRRSLAVPRLALAGLLVMFGGCHDPSAGADADRWVGKSDKDIIQTIGGDGPVDMAPLSTFLSALQAAGLIDYLSARSAPGPFTVFAPTNEAFAALPPGTLEDLLSPQGKDRLRALLLYHVHPGSGILARDASTMSLSTADGGQTLAVSVVGGTVMVNDAKVIKPDVICSNGIVHWIDKVVMPPAAGTPATPGR